MNYLDIDKALVEITRAKCAECKARLDAIPKDRAGERKALLIENGMYTLCGNAGLLFNAGWERQRTYQIRNNFFNMILPKFPKHQEVYNTLNDDEKLSFMAAWQADLFMRDQLLAGYLNELAQAEAAGDAKNTFELRIKVGAVREMLSLWATWRKENNIYPIEIKEE
ncbi:MAG: hypothetical protein E7661_01860 [Ruminococcaceae bacterium]|nr:hypothetical protein [Oscillospiraceae bacterium]